MKTLSKHFHLTYSRRFLEANYIEIVFDFSEMSSAGSIQQPKRVLSLLQNIHIISLQHRKILMQSRSSAGVVSPLPYFFQNCFRHFQIDKG
jgi:hypothetical protein